MKPFLALITPIGADPEPPQPGQPPGIWGPPGPWPTPPIQLPPWLITGGNPPGIWGGGNVPMPSPPIANVPGLPPMGPNYPGQPPGIWGGGNVPMPNPPIANVPGAPGYNPNPPGIWGPLPGFPTPPISGIPGLPGYEPPKPGEGPQQPPLEMKVGWTAQTGWIVVWVPSEGTPVVTPSTGVENP